MPGLCYRENDPISLETDLELRKTIITLNCTDSSAIAWWIAFGPHGPRALTPPGEWRSVFFLTFVGLGVSAVIFYAIQLLARPPPKTMTKEWQEATNEYLKVRLSRLSELLRLPESMTPMRKHADIHYSYRKRGSIPSTVSAAKVTVERAMYRANQHQRTKGVKSNTGTSLPPPVAHVSIEKGARKRGYQCGLIVIQGLCSIISHIVPYIQKHLCCRRSGPIVILLSSSSARDAIES